MLNDLDVASVLARGIQTTEKTQRSAHTIAFLIESGIEDIVLLSLG